VLHDKRLTLCHVKVGGTEALVSPLAKKLRRCVLSLIHPRFVIIDFKW